jgi:hypothetical protein
MLAKNPTNINRWSLPSQNTQNTQNSSNNIGPIDLHVILAPFEH